MPSGRAGDFRRAAGKLGWRHPDGRATTIPIPIGLWREIQSERENAYLLSSETMKQRLFASKQRQDGLSLEAVVGISTQPIDDVLRVAIIRLAAS